MELTHRFNVLSAPDVKGRASKDEKSTYFFELTFSDEKAIVEMALGRIQTILVHKWIKDHRWEPNTPTERYRIDEKGEETLTPEEMVSRMSEAQRKEAERKATDILRALKAKAHKKG